MSLQVRCPACQTVCAIPENGAGKSYRCNKCQKVFRVSVPGVAPPSSITVAPKDVQKPAPSRPVPAVPPPLSDSLEMNQKTAPKIVEDVRSEASPTQRPPALPPPLPDEPQSGRRGSIRRSSRPFYLYLVLSAMAVLGAGGWLIYTLIFRQREAEPIVTRNESFEKPLVAGDKPVDPLSAVIPQDHARQEQRFTNMLAWNQRTLLGAYEKVGKKDPRWDRSARAALEKAARNFSHALEPRTKLEDVFTAAKEAIEAGCDDPLILYLYATSSYKPNYPGPAEQGRRYVAAAAVMERGVYPPFRRITALKKAALVLSVQNDVTGKSGREALRLCDAALVLLAQSVKDDEKNTNLEDNWYQLVMAVIECHYHLNRDYQAAFAYTDAALAPIQELQALRLRMQGEFFIHFAWIARGSGFANTVTEEGFRLFKERLLEARKALNESWKLQPHSNTATLMITVEKGIGGRREDMEMWFTRAMKENGDCKEACSAKLDWLDPKWHGTPEEMMAFGRDCRATRNWRVGITLLIAEAHIRLAKRLPPAQSTEYFPTPSVWNEIREVYEEYLQHYPDEFVAHSDYAAYCFMCGQHDDAEKHFDIVGDDIQANAFHFPKEWINQTRVFLSNRPEPPENGVKTIFSLPRAKKTDWSTVRILPVVDGVVT